MVGTGEQGNGASALRLRRLIEASQCLARATSLDELLPQLMGLAEQATGARAGSILLWDAERAKLVFRHAHNDDPRVSDRLVGHVELDLGQGLAGWVAAERRSVLVADAARDERFFRQADAATGEHTTSLLAAPLICDDELVGVIEVLNPRQSAQPEQSGQSGQSGQFDAEDLEVLESFAGLAAVAVVRSRLWEESLEHQAFLSQCEAAARIQATFRPKLPRLAGGGVWAESLPALFVGGDIYDCMDLPDGAVLAYVADIAGKGLPAALVMTALWAAVRGRDLTQPDCAQLMADVNRAMFQALSGVGFATMALVRYRPDTGEAELVLAGHPPPFVVLPGCPGAAMLLRGAGLPLGVQRDAVYPCRRVRLEPGESLILATDGLHELADPAGRFFEDAMESGIGADCPGLPGWRAPAEPPRASSLLAAAQAFGAGSPARDDMTLLEIWRSA